MHTTNKVGRIFFYLTKILLFGLDENLFLREEASILERHRRVHSEEHPFRKVGHQVVLFGWEALAVDILDHRLKEKKTYDVLSKAHSSH